MIQKLTTERDQEIHRDRCVTLVTGTAKKYVDLGCEVITDQPTDIGPMGGLNAALHHEITQHGPGWICMASCDLVNPKRAWLDSLARICQNKESRAVAYRGTRWEPMLACYHTDLIETIKKQIHSQHYAMQSLLNLITAKAVPLPDSLAALPQANTPDELHQHISTKGAA